MTTVPWASLHDPANAPRAAIASLLVTHDALLASAQTPRAERYAPLLQRLATVAKRSASLLSQVVKGTARDTEVVSVTNAGRIGFATARLFNEMARRQTHMSRVDAMDWATRCRRLSRDTALVVREHASTAGLGIDQERVQIEAEIRILPGAELAIAELARDPLLFAAGWDTNALADAIARWVRA